MKKDTPLKVYLTPIENGLLRRMQRLYGISRQEVLRRLLLCIRFPSVVFANSKQYKNLSSTLGKIANRLSAINEEERQRNLLLIKKLYFRSSDSSNEAKAIDSLIRSSKKSVQPKLADLTKDFLHIEKALNIKLSNHDIRYRQLAKGLYHKITEKRLDQRMKDKG